MGLGDNTRAMLITRGLAEIARLGAALGADQHTFAGLAGMGDLVATLQLAAVQEPDVRREARPRHAARRRARQHDARRRRASSRRSPCWSWPAPHGVEMPITEVMVGGHAATGWRSARRPPAGQPVGQAGALWRLTHGSWAAMTSGVGRMATADS